METKYVRVPFEVELAKKITEKSVEGRIVTKKGDNVRIVCFDVKGKAPILGLIDKEDREGFQCYDKKGKAPAYEYNELDLMLEIPEYMTFNDGDMVIYNELGDFAIIKGDSFNDDGKLCFHFEVASIAGYEAIMYYSDRSYVSLDKARIATEDDKQYIIEKLKSCGDKESEVCLEKYFGIKEVPNHSNSSNIGKDFEFKPFDKVLVRDNYKDSKWGCDLFSHKNEDGLYVCIGQIWENCIPYNEQTAHLLGTTEKYE